VKKLITDQNYQLLVNKDVIEYLKNWKDPDTDASQPIWPIDAPKRKEKSKLEGRAGKEEVEEGQEKTARKRHKQSV